MVRSGIDLQGGHFSAQPCPYATRPVLSLKARLLTVRHMPMGAPIGYNRTYRVSKAAGERIGVVSIGYADGYPRHLSNKGVVLVRGQRCPVVGLVCMDYTMISLENVPDAQVGDDVAVIGQQGDEMVSLAEVARAAETIPYELMCSLGPRVERRYVGGGR
jgi:alanine racemase